MYEFLTALLSPYPILVLLVALALVQLWWKHRELRRRLLPVVIPFAILVLLSLGPVGHLVLGTLEWQNPPLARRPDDAQAIVVLAAGLRPPDAVRARAEMDDQTLFRCLAASALYHDGPGCPLVVSGGKSDPSAQGPPAAQLMHDFLRELGVRESDLIVEDGSRTTYENAVACRRLLEERGIHSIVLVTDAVHMVRAAGCFRAQGLEVVPAACHHAATEYTFHPADLVPSADDLRRCQAVSHEWVGIAWYQVRGRM